jgi:lysophospholipase L1-like esterase
MRASCLVSLAVAVLASAPIRAGDFPLQNGDIWVMAGDSITAQHLHSNYFEAFCFARYPGLKFAFRNSGVGGHTIPSTMARFNYDIEAWKPTLVSVELGMNDQGGTLPEQYIANMTKMVGMIRGIKARPVMFTASPINNGNTMANIGGNKRLHEYAVVLKEYSAKEQLPFADQFHALVDIWGKNKPRENLANALPGLRGLAQEDKLAGVEHLRAFLTAQDKDSNKPLSMQGDPVHPGAPGQLMMAAALLHELGAKSFVSSATIDAVSKNADAKGCTIDGVKNDDGKLVFDRMDECLPFPIPDEARPVLALYPTILDLSQYTLKVRGLKGDTYQLKVNGMTLGTVSGRELEQGVNLTSYGVGPIAGQGKVVLAAVAAKEGIVGQWRGLSQKVHAPNAAPELKDTLAEMTKRVEAADAKIREAAQPQKLHFELEPVK